MLLLNTVLSFVCLVSMHSVAGNKKQLKVEYDSHLLDTVEVAELQLEDEYETRLEVLLEPRRQELRAQYKASNDYRQRKDANDKLRSDADNMYDREVDKIEREEEKQKASV